VSNEYYTLANVGLLWFPCNFPYRQKFFPKSSNWAGHGGKFCRYCLCGRNGATDGSNTNEESLEMLTLKAAYELGFDHGFQMAQESGDADAGTDGWDGMLINADPQFVREQFGWIGPDPSQASQRRLRAYCRGAQAGANAACDQ
jgi:hypothetical protein